MKYLNKRSSYYLIINGDESLSTNLSSQSLVFEISQNYQLTTLFFLIVSLLLLKHKKNFSIKKFSKLYNEIIINFRFITFGHDFILIKYNHKSNGIKEFNDKCQRHFLLSDFNSLLIRNHHLKFLIEFTNKFKCQKKQHQLKQMNEQLNKSNRLSTQILMQFSNFPHGENSEDQETSENIENLQFYESAQHDQSQQPLDIKLLKNDNQQIYNPIAIVIPTANNFQLSNEFNNNQNQQVHNKQQLAKLINQKENNAQYGKNAAKQLGNYLRKHIVKKKLTYIHQLANFVNKKKINKQANYTLQDWREMLLDNNEHYKCQEIVMEYLKNWAYIDILLEYKQTNPIEMIEHIQHFISGCQDPSKLIFRLIRNFCVGLVINFLNQYQLKNYQQKIQFFP
ncbi:hypothetical protein pb186bvf_009212 [Paramecium bursaria]